MNVQTYLERNGIAYELHVHPRTYTAQGLAHAEHVSGYQIAKPVVVKSKSGFAMCVLPAPRHLDLRAAGEVLQEEVRLATEAEMASLFPDCDLGAQPPIGPMFNLKTIMDSGLREDDHLIMQAGTHTEAVRVRRTDWEKLCSPLVANITSH